MSNIPTPHIECDNPDLIAKTVLMPGDPLRAKFIADNYLTDVVCFNKVRNIFGYTGYYKKKKVSVMASGMGMPSIGIYSNELYKFYGVEEIIRIGSAGSYDESLDLLDVVVVSAAYSDSSYAKVSYGMGSKTMKPTRTLTNRIINTAKKLEIPCKEAMIYSSDAFYTSDNDLWKKMHAKGCMAVEMESFALFANAKENGKKAACILTISDSFVKESHISSIDRQNSLTKMIELALNCAK